MTRRLVLLIAIVVLVAIAGTAYVTRYVLAGPQPVAGTTSGKDNQPTTNIKLETVAAINAAVDYPRNDAHADWVAYLPTTVLKVPANSTVNVTIDQEDTATGLRNPFWGRLQGVVGGKFHMTYLDDKGNKQAGDFSSINPDDAAHTFAIPDLGVYVPLQGVSASAPAGSKNVITFSFRTHGPGVYRWQCFVPCGAGTLFGNGGPMSTYGYMGGTLVVE